MLPRSRSFRPADAHRRTITHPNSADRGPGSPTLTASPAPTSPILKIPDPVAVEVPVNGAALLVLDITSVIRTPRPTCVTPVPRIAALVGKARDAKARVIYSQAATAYIADIAPQAGDAAVTGRANKF